ncbi:MAG: DUF4290 domain-containing protein [Flavobacteriaceae bacterium]|jgi:hypothetical protein|nr:DUF4290 domain-containing protein [Flavobacteriaceae bacterium]
MEYNTQRKKLIIPEYGRHVQQLVDHCVTIENEEDRNKFAGAIIDVMGEMNPHLRDIPDFQHKLWDQLYIMSDFKLQVNAPYTLLSREEMITPPRKMHYPVKETKYRYYGTTVKKMIEVAKTWEEGDRKEGLKIAIANQMKKNYLKWNKDQIEDEVIFTHLEELSDGSLKANESDELVAVTAQQMNSSQLNNNTKNAKRKTQKNKIKKN